MPTLDELRLIDALHGGFPLVDRPFAAVAKQLDMQEDAAIQTISNLLTQGVLTRFGPLFQIERVGGQFVLAAMRVPDARFDQVADQVNAMVEVAHNYRREHVLNMWFVVASASPQQAQEVLARIQAETGLTVWAFPKEREYFVELRLPLLQAVKRTMPTAPTRAPSHQTLNLTPHDHQLMALTQAGLPVVAEPYAHVGAQMGQSAQWVRTRLQDMLHAGLIRRIGAVPNHYRLGFIANGMSVWDVDDAHVDALGARIGALPGVSHCYRRPRHGSEWPYNLFAMLHGRSREEVHAQAQELKQLLGSAHRGHDILYSSAILKKTGWRMRRSEHRAES